MELYHANQFTYTEMEIRLKSYQEIEELKDLVY